MQQKPSTILIANVLYLSAIAVSLLAIFLLPDRAHWAGFKMLYSYLIILAFVDLALMKSMDQLTMKAYRSRDSKVAAPKPHVAPIVLVPTSLSQHNIFLAERCGRFLWSTQMERHARCMRR